jgi:hypothetical protein
LAPPEVGSLTPASEPPRELGDQPAGQSIAHAVELDRERLGALQQVLRLSHVARLAGAGRARQRVARLDVQRQPLPERLAAQLGAARRLGDLDRPARLVEDPSGRARDPPERWQRRSAFSKRASSSVSRRRAWIAELTATPSRRT